MASEMRPKRDVHAGLVTGAVVRGDATASRQVKKKLKGAMQ